MGRAADAAANRSMMVAGDWMKMRCDLPDDPAVIGIAGATGLDEDAVVGKLHRLWSWADRQTTDGNAPSVSKVWVDRYVRADGFADAMQAAGWLSVDSVGVSFPNFSRHNGQSAKRRALTANRVARHAAKTNATANQNTNDSSVSPGVNREEKRREENPPPPPDSEWQEVEGVLLKMGMTQAKAAVAAAKGNGLTEADVEALVAYWRSQSGAYGVGALYERILNHRPGMAIDKLWPAPAPEYAAKNLREQRSDQAAKTIAKYGRPERQALAGAMAAVPF